MNSKKTFPLILASASPRRIELLHACGLEFRVLPSDVPEDTALVRPAAIVKQLALRKAETVAAKHPQGIVIGADTIVVFNGEIIGKPVHQKDAVKILRKLAGTRHRVYSGIAVVHMATGRTVVEYEASTVKMRKMSLKEISDVSHKHLDKAGAYAVQEKDDAFVERIEGDYFNVVGLPLVRLRRILRKFGVDLSRCPQESLKKKY
ncbi:MAG: septum formation protein Maf [Elusimicrobia bacterium RIFOXYB2_FULL_49_7]|nr:MAG: septum formation protein Maf [Elusimicrobia bacterium RIFOXYB2_FULL_49_7]